MSDETPLFREIPVTELRDAMQDVLKRAKARGVSVTPGRSAARPATIVAVCVHCDEVIHREDVRIKTPQGVAHGRCAGQPANINRKGHR